MQAPKEHLIFQLLADLKECNSPETKSQIYELLFKDPECLYAKDSFGYTPLLKTVMDNWTEGARLIILQIRGLNRTTIELDKALQQAIKNQNINLVTRLLRYVHDLKKMLPTAIETGNMDILRLLLERTDKSSNNEILEIFKVAFAYNQPAMITEILHYNPEILPALINNYFLEDSEQIDKIIPLAPLTYKVPDLLRIALKADQRAAFISIAMKQEKISPLLLSEALNYAIYAWLDLNSKTGENQLTTDRVNAKFLKKIIVKLLKQGAPVSMRLYTNAINNNGIKIIEVLRNYDPDFPCYKNILLKASENKPDSRQFLLEICPSYADDILNEQKVKAYIREHGELGMCKIAPLLLDYTPHDSHQNKNIKLRFFAELILNNVTDKTIITSMVHLLAKDTALFSNEILHSRNILLEKLVAKYPLALLAIQEGMSVLDYGIENKNSFLLTLLAKHKNTLTVKGIIKFILHVNKNNMGILIRAADKELWDYCNVIIMAFKDDENLPEELNYGSTLEIFVQKNHLLCAEAMLCSSGDIGILETRFNKLMLQAIKNKYPAMMHLLLSKRFEKQKPLSVEILKAAQSDPNCMHVIETTLPYEQFEELCRRLAENVDRLEDFKTFIEWKHV